MKTNNYKDKSPEELNKLLATMICGWEAIGHDYVFRYYEDYGMYGREEFWDKVMPVDEWNPCDQHSAQIQNYVIPAMGDDVWVEIHYVRAKRVSISIHFWKESLKDINKGRWVLLVTLKCYDLKKQNQVVAATCLEAFESIEGEKK